MERTIKVTGKGRIAVKPDQIRLTIELSGCTKEYEDCVHLSTLQTASIKDEFEKLGFQKESLKTTYFNVDTKYESYRDKNNDYKTRLEGYEFKHHMKIEFDADNGMLGKVLYSLAHSEVKPEFRFGYCVKDIEASKNELLGNAVKDSMEKARVLADASGVKLGEIVMIDYSWGELDMYVEPMGINRMMLAEPCSCEDAYDMDVEPDDIDVTDTVTVVWKIA